VHMGYAQSRFVQLWDPELSLSWRRRRRDAMRYRTARNALHEARCADAKHDDPFFPAA
jgi:hypothetical protein